LSPPSDSQPVLPGDAVIHGQRPFTGEDRPPSGFGRDLRLLTLANLLFAVGLGLYLQFFYPYVRDLGAPAYMVGVMGAVLFFFTAAGYIPGAWLADHVRLKPVIVAIWWITVPAAISFALAPSWPWLFPGLVLSGIYMMNNPAFKSYILLKSEPARISRNMSYVLASYPLGIAVGPLLGGLLIDRYDMRLVFCVSAVFFALSSTAVTFISDTPYHAAGRPWKLDDLTGSRQFRRVLAFFFVAYLAAYLAQPFVQLYLKEVHGQGYVALGVFATIGAIGGSLITMVSGRTTDLYGARWGVGGVLACILLGAVLLLTGWTPLVWALAVFFYGAFDAVRFLAFGIAGRSFGGVPPTWGYAIFDTAMGVPMFVGSLVGGVLYEFDADLPFIVVTAMIAVMLVLLSAARFVPSNGRRARARDHGEVH
jgi:MFS transporter, DHA1 family, tetracycline resistance protein